MIIRCSGEIQQSPPAANSWSDLPLSEHVLPFAPCYQDGGQYFTIVRDSWQSLAMKMISIQQLLNHLWQMISGCIVWSRSIVAIWCSRLLTPPSWFFAQLYARYCKAVCSGLNFKEEPDKCGWSSNGKTSWTLAVGGSLGTERGKMIPSASVANRLWHNNSLL